MREAVLGCLFFAQGHQRLSPLVDGINRAYGRRTIGFGLFPSEVRDFKDHAPFSGSAGELGILTVTPANPYSAQRQYKPPRAVLTG